ncbi:rhodanese-related sulfurtransferase [Candidatus Synchoanobacter obligatus]|nr:rhodanese-related sulfurtransferase [Candidatus Synchoanobacter obligatus]
MMLTVAALYEFKKHKMNEALRVAIMECCQKYDVLGTLLLADEGINGTIAGSQAGVDAVLVFIRECGFQSLEWKLSHAVEKPFLRLKVIWKEEIVTIGCDVDPCEIVGDYVTVNDWNDLIVRDDVLLIDTRNNYEYELGTFKGADNPDTECFREFPRYVANIDREKYQSVAMFCTGGIRCEKASSYMLAQGFKKVYHLKGGVLKYLEEIQEEESLWEGACFVFDRRVALGHGLKITDHIQCYACRRALTPEDAMHPDYQKGVSCRYCIHMTSEARQASFVERQRQVEMAVSQGKEHIGQRIE